MSLKAITNYAWPKSDGVVSKVFVLIDEWVEHLFTKRVYPDTEQEC